MNKIITEKELYYKNITEENEIEYPIEVFKKAKEYARKKIENKQIKMQMYFYYLFEYGVNYGKEISKHNRLN